MSKLTFWPYCIAVIKRDLSKLRKSRIVHILIFLIIAVILTICEERKLAHISLGAIGYQVVRLLGEIFSDRLVGDNLLANVFNSIKGE